MGFIQDIFRRATIRGIADYLRYGVESNEDSENYEERLDEAYRKFEKIVHQYDPDVHSELLNSANELVSETADIYMEIGLSAGVLLMKDLLQNVDM